VAAIASLAYRVHCLMSRKLQTNSGEQITLTPGISNVLPTVLLLQQAEKRLAEQNSKADSTAPKDSEVQPDQPDILPQIKSTRKAFESQKPIRLKGREILTAPTKLAF